jgi:uncharacterized protein (DUF433 family)
MSMPAVNSLNQHITQTPGVCGGKPCIAGSRIRVQDIYVWHELQSQSVDEIIAKFPQLTHADVYAALAYFWDNRQAILEEIKAGDQLIEELKRRMSSEAQSRLRGQSDADPVPS